MSTGTIFFLLLLLACPLMMVLMMRGGHGAHGAGGHSGHGCGHGGGHDHSRAEEVKPSLDELRHQRDELDRAITAREAEEEREPVGTQAGAGR